LSRTTVVVGKKLPATMRQYTKR